MDNLIYWIWLSLAVTPGSDNAKRLLDKYGTAKKIYESDESDIASVITSKSADFSALSTKELKKSEEILEFCTSKGVGLLAYDDKRFPNSLRNIKNPPVLLYYRGTLPDFNGQTFISVVGTRNLSDYGRDNAFSIANDLARAGAIIVSGMAIGVDGVALAGAIAASMPTVAVIGSGIDVCYPKAHLRLAREIVKQGCVLTEYPPKSRPAAHNFPRRNRIISALSSATVLIEGNEKSGALITARCAKQQGKIVYALPGNVDSSLSAASNLLIKNGAKLLTSADDIVSDYDRLYPGTLNPFLLAEPTDVDMKAVLTELNVSCITPLGRILLPFGERAGAKQKLSPKAKKSKKEPQKKQAEEESSDNNNDLLTNLDPKLKSLYSKIPTDKECPIEALIDTEHSLRDVMSGILSLEVSGLVTMLPGDKVKRNSQ